MTYSFNATDATRATIAWIQDFFAKNGDSHKAVVGISGGKDSSVVAALCAAALGTDCVLGVLMPNGMQHDIQDSLSLVEFLGIDYVVVNIADAVSALSSSVNDAMNTSELSVQSATNLPARVRMATLYAVSQNLECGGRVANTCNLSEDWIGYSTRYGDSVGDFSPLSNFTVGEVRSIGRVLGLPSYLVDKAPSDGLCGKTDEDNLGFTYAELDAYIREGAEPCPDTKSRIDGMHEGNLFKLELMPSFNYFE